MLYTTIRRSSTLGIAALLVALCVTTRLRAQDTASVSRELPRSVLHTLTPSFSTAPKAMFRRRGARGAMFDYAKQTVWLSANVHDVLPAGAKPFWPSALRVSAGRRGLGAGLPAEYVLGLDLDAGRLPGTHPAWMQIKAALHTLRLPGPAIVVGPNGTRALGLYW